MAASFDAVVLGAGSAGCALAARLSEEPGRQVLLVEAGGTGRGDPRIALAPLAVALHGSRHDWNYRTEPEAQLDGRRLRWPRGRVVGGSSATNYSVYLQGHPAGYDSWEAAGCTGWAYRDVLPFFRRLEDHPLGPSAWHGAGGPVAVREPGWGNELTHGFVEAAGRVGIPYSHDLEGERPEGAGLYRVTIRNGVRESAATAYLGTAAQRPNLTVLTEALVDRILIRDGRAMGAVLSRRGESLTVHARAVALCAGAVGSPAILMRSGIGDPGELERLGVPVVAQRPQVGAQLADHLLVPVIYAGPAWQTAPAALLSPRSLARFLIGRKGPWSSNVAEAGAIVRTRDDIVVPDLQITFAAGSILDHGRSVGPPAFSLSVVGLQPRSRGRLTLHSRDPRAAPRIEPHYLRDPDDLAVLRRGVELAREIAASPPLSRLARRELHPGPRAADARDVEAWIRRRAQTSYHPVGTCRMGSDADAVVDPRLRVRGVEALWVADGSVMPQIPAANTNAACMMIGERAADLIAGDV